MKKSTSIYNRLFTELFSAALILLILLSLILNPVAATVVEAATAQKATTADNFIGNSTASPDEDLPSPAATFTNNNANTIPDQAQANIYPWSVTTSGLVGPISNISVTLTGFTSPRPRDLDILLVGPGGQNLMIMSDAGGVLAAAATTNQNITLSDSGAANLTQAQSPITTGTYKPTDFDGADPAFPAPAPAIANRPAPAGSATFNSVFGGLSGASVNGTWSLYIVDDAGSSGASNSIASWTLDITTAATASATTTAITSSLNPSNTNQAVTFTATVSSTSTVNSGTVTFTDTTTGATLCSNVSVNASGVATCLVAANTFTERVHTITATYNGNATFATSNASLQQTVNTPTQVVGNQFTNPGTITIADNVGGAQSVPYPSNISVSGLSGSISKVTVSLLNVNLPNTGDVDLLLVGPGGQKYVFMSDAGGTTSTSTGTITLDDAGATLLPTSGAIAAGTYKPTDYAANSDQFPAPAPAGPYNMAPTAGSATFATVFGGAAPNGTWSLYATDDAGSGNVNQTINGWRLTITTTSDAATTTVVTSSPNPSSLNQAVTFTATVTSGGNPVTVGTVTFRRGATVLCANVSLSATGTATCTPAANTFNMEGDFVITADYNGAAGQFNISSGTVTQTVNSPTVVNCLTFANNGGITVSNSTQRGNPYPSKINVAGLAGTISKVTLTLGNVNAPTPDDVDFLLVGPGGQKFQFISDAGGTTAIVNQTITLDDAAANALPDATAITTGTYRPASYAANSDQFPSPAPAGPYNPAAPEGAGTFANIFNGINPNGAWNLYITEDAGDAADTVIGNWSLTFALAPATTTTTVTSSLNPSTFGQSVIFTATVTSAGGTPTGTVEFFDGATSLGTGTLNASGVATLTTSSLTVGTHTITAQYGGASSACTGTFGTSSGALAGGQVVNKANSMVSLATSANPSVFGQSVTFTATVAPVAPATGTPTGTVSFFDGGNAIAGCSNIALSGGQAQCATTALSVGSHTITAQYSGNTNLNASSGSLASPQIVNKANTSVSVASSANPSVFGQSVNLTATISVTSPGNGSPTGTVSFLDGGNPIAGCTSVAVSGGQAVCATTALGVGNHTITAQYSGDGNFNGATGSLTGNPQVVNKANTSVSVASSQNPSVFGQSITLTATIAVTAPGAGTPTGTVSFLDGGNTIAGCSNVAISGGQAQCVTAALGAGNHTITAQYGGDGNFNTSTGSLTGNPQVVNKANTSVNLTSSLNPSALGQSVTFTATISVIAPGAGTPTGTVQFLDGGNPIAGCTSVAISGGQAQCSTAALTAGNHTITAQYGGDGNFNTATGSLTGNPQVVNAPTASISDVRITEGNSGTVTATFTITATGNGSTPLSVQFSTANGTATAGSDYVAVNNQTVNFTAGQSTQTFTVTVNGDTLKEANEFFYVNLSNPTNVVISDNQAVGIIVDDDRAYTGDFDLDRKTDFSVFRPSTGFWYTLRSTDNTATFQSFGANGDVPVPGDYNGDGKADFAVFRPSSGTWYTSLDPATNYGARQWGVATDKPVQGDYDGDGKTDIAVFRDGTWFVIPSSNNQPYAVSFGAAGDVPVQGDYDGDARTDYAVYRGGTWFVRLSSNNSLVTQNYGAANDIPIVGDFDGDGRTDFTVYRGGTWFILETLTGNQRAVTFGAAGDVPAAGDYDGDGTSDIAVFRPSSGVWYVVGSSAGVFGIQWGQSGDVPIPANYQAR